MCPDLPSARALACSQTELLQEGSGKREVVHTILYCDGLPSQLYPLTGDLMSYGVSIAWHTTQCRGSSRDTIGQKLPQKVTRLLLIEFSELGVGPNLAKPQKLAT